MIHIGYLLADNSRLARWAFDRQVREVGVTGPQARLLLNLHRRPGENQRFYAEQLEVEPITVGRLIDRLEARGVVERRDDPKDRRIHRLHLTPKAKPILREIADNIVQMDSIMSSGIDEKTLDLIATGLKTMKANLTLEESSLRKSAG